jgi:hypothetical protein
MQLQVEKGVLTDEWVSSMCMTSYGVGIETIAITISTFINHIVDQNCQERVHEEIDKARKKWSNPPKLREMRKCHARNRVSKSPKSGDLGPPLYIGVFAY